MINSRLVLLPTTATQEFTGEIANGLAIHYPSFVPGGFVPEWYKGGETMPKPAHSIRGAEVFVVGAMYEYGGRSNNDHYMELKLLGRACKETASKVNLVIGWLGYSKQETQTAPNEPPSVKQVAIEMEGIFDRVFLFDLHNNAIRSIFRIPVEHLTARYILARATIAKWIETKIIDPSNLIVVACDEGGVDRTKKFRNSLLKYLIEKGYDINTIPLGVIFKDHPLSNAEVEIIDLCGDFKGRTALMFDDMTITGNTLIKDSEELKRQGVKKVFSVLSHAVLAEGALEKIDQSVIDELIVTNTIPLSRTPGKIVRVVNKITQINVGPLMGEALYRFINNFSISHLLEGDPL